MTSITPMQKKNQWGPIVGSLLAFLILLANLLSSNGILLIFMAAEFMRNPPDFSEADFQLGIWLEDLVQTLLQQGYLLSVTVIVGALASILVILLIFRLSARTSARAYLALNPFRARSFLFFLLIYISFMILSEVAGRLLDRPEVPQFMEQIICNPGSYVLLYIAVAIFAPVFEELLFRGFWYQALIDSRVGIWGALLIPNFFWTVIHLQYDWYDMLQIFIIGLILGLARFHSKSLYVPIILHIIQNSIAFGASLYLIQCDM